MRFNKKKFNHKISFNGILLILKKYGYESYVKKEDRIKKIRVKLKPMERKIVKARILRKVGGYSKQTALSRTNIIKLGYATQLGNGFYYVNIQGVQNGKT